MYLDPSKTPKDHEFYLKAIEARNDEEDSYWNTIFSTRFQRDNISWIDIGKADSSQTISNATIPILDDYFWSVSNIGVRIGEDDKKAFAY